MTGALRPLDDVLAGFRFEAGDRSASGELVVVEIDSRSLKAAGAWPWDRERYAKAIDHLTSAGVELTAIDVDFSAPSNPASDRRLAESLSRQPGQVVLATFDQSETFGPASTAIEANQPIPVLLRDALLASVNVPVDPDGRVRHYSYSGADDTRASVAAMLADARPGGGEFTIDYGIDHRSIPHLSFEDVYQGRFDPEIVRGKRVLIGATALELGDEFSTPAGLLPGVIIHALAFESIVDGRALLTPSLPTLLVLCGALIWLLRPVRTGGIAVRRLIMRHAAVVIGLLAAPVMVQWFVPVSADIAPLVVTQLLLAIWATRVELDRQAAAIIQEREAGLLHLAMHQPDTGLPNRRALQEDIERLCATAFQSVAVIAIGVERHAEMRGVVGYDVANALMKQLAGRVAEISDATVVGQVASSVLSFACVDADAEGLQAVACRLQGLERTFEVNGQAIDLFVRIGIASQSVRTASADALIERATTALNEAAGSDERAIILDEANYRDPDNNLALMSELRDGIVRGDVSLHYQPKRKTKDGRIGSVEALCRWTHAERGRMAPDVFIPIAEQTGQIRALTEWSIAQAIQDQRTLRAQGVEVAIALNVSGRLLVDADFRRAALALYEGSGADLILEITETAVIENPRVAAEAIAIYQAAGLRISIDDYGAGLSSLGYLKMLNADELKIDRSLVVDVLQSQRDRLILRSTVDLAHGLGMTVVAEGVEDAEVFACLSLLGCDSIQGYWVSRPLPLNDLIKFLENHAAPGIEQAIQAPTVAAAIRRRSV